MLYVTRCRKMIVVLSNRGFRVPCYREIGGNTRTSSDGRGLMGHTPLPQVRRGQKHGPLRELSGSRALGFRFPSSLMETGRVRGMVLLLQSRCRAGAPPLSDPRPSSSSPPSLRQAPLREHGRDRGSEKRPFRFLCPRVRAVTCLSHSHGHTAVLTPGPKGPPFF